MLNASRVPALEMIGDYQRTTFQSGTPESSISAEAMIPQQSSGFLRVALAVAWRVTHASGVFALLGNVQREDVCVSFKVRGTRFPYAFGMLHLPQGMLKSYVAAMREVKRLILLGEKPTF